MDALIRRPHVEFEPDESGHYAGRRILVTGAAGTIGREVCHQLLASGAGQVIAVDINENGLYLFQRCLDATDTGRRLLTQVANIRDRGRVEALMRKFRPEAVVHCAAHKHVPLMEMAPGEAVKNNIIATRDLLLAAERFGTDRFIFVSSDKAVRPTSVMGATKRVGEIMTRAVSERSRMRGCAVRFGNVIGSDGSVVPLFRQQIAAGGPVTITDPEVRRFFMTTREAVGLMLRAGRGDCGDLCILKMGGPVRILDLARDMIALAGYLPGVEIPIVVTGLRPGEKLTEHLTTDDEEVTAATDGRIHVVRGPATPDRLWGLVDALERAAGREHELTVLRLLQELVPTYQTSADINRLSA